MEASKAHTRGTPPPPRINFDGARVGFAETRALSILARVYLRPMAFMDGFKRGRGEKLGTRNSRGGRFFRLRSRNYYQAMNGRGKWKFRSLRSGYWISLVRE